MESAIIPSKISRINQRYRHIAQDVSREERRVAKEREAEVREKEEDSREAETIDEPLLIREQRGRPVMGRAHRMFHLRQAPTTNTLTVVVDIVATVDSAGSLIAQRTLTPVVPSSVPQLPTTAIPSVPSVPPFPSDLTVPAYPWPSGVPTAGSLGSSQLVLSSTLTPNSQNPAPTPFPSSPGFNSTMSRTILSSSTFSSANSTSASTSLSTSSSSSSRPSTTTSSSSSTIILSSSTTSTAASSVVDPGGGGVNTAVSPAASETATGSGGSNNGTAPTPTVVGSVVGSLAGAALLLALILFLIKRHKAKRRGALQLTGNDTNDSQPIAPNGQEMATRSSVLPAGAAAFLNRFSGASKSTADTSTTGEKGFQRISGRKLPSAFSEGMTSEQFARAEGTLSGSSFYKDDQGFYGGLGAAANKEFGKGKDESSTGAMGTTERIMPSPARTPVIHRPDDAPPWGASRNGGGSTLSPPHTPNPDLPGRGTLGRSHPSHDGSRSSKFTENV